MAKCVILWGEHPTEVVAQHHARQVARILREKYGHDVRLEKLPFIFTHYNLVRDPSTEPRKKLELLSEWLDSDTITRAVARQHQMPVFNFHCTPAEHMAEAERKTPEKFKLVRRGIQQTQGEIQVEKRSKNAFEVEVPAVYRLIPSRADIHMARQLQQMVEVAPEVAPKLGTVEKRHLSALLRQEYLTKVAALKAHGQKKYLHKSISEKIAAEIHRRLMQ